MRKYENMTREQLIEAVESAERKIKQLKKFSAAKLMGDLRADVPITMTTTGKKKVLHED